MDLSHMIGLWLVGQSASEGSGIEPGGVGVVYAPGVQGGAGEAEQGAGLVYPFSAGRMCLGGDSTGRMPVPPAMRAGVGLIGELEYDAEGLAGFVPRLFSAVNMVVGTAGELAAASHAAEVNRGADSIGLSDQLQFVDRFDADGEGVLGRARVVGFVERPGNVAGAGVTQSCADVAAADFPVMFEKLSDYLRFQVSAQVEGNGYEDLAGVLAKSDRPAHALVIAGVSQGVASTSRGLEPDSLAVGDVCHSVVYDGEVISLEEIQAALADGRGEEALNVEGVSWLRQELISGLG